MTQQDRKDILIRIRDAARVYYHCDRLEIGNSGMEEMRFFKSYCNRFDGYWVDVLFEDPTQPLGLQVLGETKCIVILTDDGWYIEFPFHHIATVWTEQVYKS